MSKIECQFVTFDPVINVNDWASVEESPTGTRVKVALIDPVMKKYHIFKYPKARREHQIWSELLASFIAGDLLRWDVQHASLATRGDKPGNLLRYFYEPESRTDSTREDFVEGWSLCRQVDPDYDVHKGHRHTLPLIFSVHKLYVEPTFGMASNCFLDFWARAFAFDCLISNTDRHAENWAIINGPSGVRMAPLYDNGSSLGCSLDQIGLDRAFDGDGNILPAHLEKQRKNGRHHVRAVEQCKRGSLFEEVCGEFLKCYPQGRYRFEEAERLNIEAVGELMDAIGEQNCFSSPYRLTTNRQKHIFAMLRIGKERIRNILRGASQ